MKRVLSALAALALLFACSPENNPDNGGNNNNDGGNTQPTVVELTGIALTEHEITLEKGGNKVLEVQFTPENATNKLLTWVSSNPSIVTVTDGVVVGMAPGSTEIIVNSGNLTDKCQVTVVISATSVSLDQPELILAPGETATLKATVLPDDSTDEVEWSSSDETVATVQDGVVSAVAEGSATITAKAGEKTATCSVRVESKMQAVDLGLSVKWSSCNLGATKPEEYGDYFAWGETEPYYTSQNPLTWKDGKTAGYNWASYKWCNGSYNTLTKYNTNSSYGVVDNKTVLDPEDDAAHVVLGDKWRMPTDAEWTELRENCTWIWTSDYNGTGIAGRIVTSNKTGYTDKFIFLPAAGIRGDTRLDNAGSYGHYWSSSLDAGYPSGAWLVGFDSGSFGRGGNRCFGQSVRPVSE